MKAFFVEGPLHGTCRDVAPHMREYRIYVRPPVSVTAFNARNSEVVPVPSPKQHIYMRNRAGDYNYAGEA